VTCLVVADLDRRLHAFVADLVIVSGTALGVALLAHWTAGDVVVPVVATVAGASAALAALAALLGTTGRTPGLAVFGLRVVPDHDGRPIGVGLATLRVLVVASATAPCGLGLIALAATALTDPAGRRRGWHDRLVDSVVVEVRVAVEVDVAETVPGPVLNLTAARLVLARGGPVASPRAPTRAAVSTARTPIRWGLVLDDGDEAAVDGVVLVGRAGSAALARVEVARDGALVVTDLGTADRSQVRRGGVSRPIGAGRSVTLLEDDVVTLGDRTVTVVRRAPASLPSDEHRR